MTQISNNSTYVYLNKNTIKQSSNNNRKGENNIGFSSKPYKATSTLTKVGIGVAAFYGLLAVGDLVFTKGKNLKKVRNFIKNFVSKFKNKQIEKPVTNSQSISTIEPLSFFETTEGKRLSSMTSEEFEQECIKRGNAVFEELNIPENVRPQIRLNNREGCGGYHEAGGNIINVCPDDAIVYLDHVLMHESIHARESLLRGCLTTEQRNGIIKDELLQRIIKGNDSINVALGHVFGKSMRAPYIPSEMRKEYADFINKYMLKNDSETKNKMITYFEKKDYLKITQCEEDKIKIPQFLSEMQNKSELSELKTLVRKNPKFAEQYSSEEEALDELYKYTFSFNTRFNAPYVTTSKDGKILKLYENPSPEQIKDAEQSLRNYIRTFDGESENIFGGKLNLNEYRFSPEELLCEQKGSQYAIERMKKQLEELKSAGKLSEQEGQYLNSKIKEKEEYIQRLTENAEKYYTDKGYSI